MKSIYITKDLEEVTQLKQFCTFQNIDLHAQSQISFEAVPFSQGVSF